MESSFLSAIFHHKDLLKKWKILAAERGKGTVFRSFFVCGLAFQSQLIIEDLSGKNLFKEPDKND
tara:strand:+ start:56 stop:250 length:195 start_codon:yes stop_codon:yes gene_type:complete